MCGRAYFTVTEEELHFNYLNRKSWPWPVESVIPSFRPNYNLCPTQTALVLGIFDGVLKFREMRWGLVPGWAKSVKDADKYSLINARGEEIAEKKTYKTPFRKRRCILPISGFFEWLRTPDGKRPFAIYPATSPVMSLAGVWEEWQSPEAEKVLSFSLVTTGSNSFMAKIHDRMPVILDEEDQVKWLDPKFNDPVDLSLLIKGCPSEFLACHEVSKAVNSPKNNSPEVLKKVA